MEGDIFCKVCLQLIGQFLPTPSHGGRPLLLPDQHRHVLISTHALTWRATEADGFACAIVGISTHALTWRATGSSYLTIDSLVDFYPRPHMEGDFS